MVKHFKSSNDDNHVNELEIHNILINTSKWHQMFLSASVLDTAPNVQIKWSSGDDDDDEDDNDGGGGGTDDDSVNSVETQRKDH